MDEEFYRQQALRVRDLAGKADPFTRRRLLDLAARYDAKGGAPFAGVTDHRTAAATVTGETGLELRTVRRGMKKPRPIEFECEACKGTGFPPVRQPEPGRRIYPAPCRKCGGKGRIAAIALANKIARMAWAMMAKGERYKQPAALAR
jgi:hypothetical protein